MRGRASRTTNLNYVIAVTLSDSELFSSDIHRPGMVFDLNYLVVL